MSANWQRALSLGAAIGLIACACGIAPAAETPPGSLATRLDWAIDLTVGKRVDAKMLSSTDGAVAREQLQLQFLALPRATQDEILANAARMGGETGAVYATRAVYSATQDAVRDAVAQVSPATRAIQVMNPKPTAEPKLGLLSNDLVFNPTVGPCRVADTRSNINANWPGPIPPLGARQIWAFYDSVYDWSTDQGGTGKAGAGNCVGTLVNLPGPIAVVATVSVTNTSATGALRAWNGTGTLTVGASNAWVAGDIVANTTVIPLDRIDPPYPNSGPYKRDFAVYNNSFGPVDVIVDVIGYLSKNTATPLDCVTVTGRLWGLSGGAGNFPAPACPAGYTRILGSMNLPGGFVSGGVLPDSCTVTDEAPGPTYYFSCDAYCCRVPGQ